MPVKIQLRRITNTQRLALTGANAPKSGEPIWTTDTRQLFIGDGTTAGGLPVKLDWENLENIPGYVDDVLEFANLAAFPATGETGKIYTRLDTNQIYRWSGSAYVELSSGGTADAAIKLQTARTITLTGGATGSTSFDGSANVTLPVTVPTDTTRAPLASPALTGTPTAPTAAVGTNTTQLATTAFVRAEIAAMLANAVLDGGTV